jgi:hypothetical protein
VNESTVDSALGTAAAELRQIGAITSPFPAEEIADGVTVAVRSLREAAAILGSDSPDAIELEAIATSILDAEDHTTVPAGGAEPDYALAFRGMEEALARLTAYIATREGADPEVS